MSFQKHPHFLSNGKKGSTVHDITKGKTWRFSHQTYTFYIVKQRIMQCNTRHFRQQHAAFCCAKCRFSYFGMAFSATKRDVFIAHSRCLVHNRLIYRILSLHTFPCGFHGLRYFYFQSPPYFRVMENQKESRQAQIVTRSKQPPPLFGSSEIRSDSPPLLSAG